MLRTLLGIGLLLLSFIAASAQSFEVASIKPAAPMESGRIMIGMHGGPGTPDPVHITITNMSLSDLVQNAYNVKAFQVTGPAWLTSTRFDLEIKVPAGATKEQARVMMQNLLAERFKVVLHHSTKESPIYALLVAKNGPRLKESAKEDPNAAPPPDVPVSGGGRSGGMIAPIGKDGMPQMPTGARAGRGSVMMMMAPGGKMRMMVNAATMQTFIDALASQLDRPVVDMTELKGTYDITLDFAPDPAITQARMAAMGLPPKGGSDGAGPGGNAQDPGEAATVFSALPDQLGLRLEARKGPVEMLVIDSAQKTPTDN